jgi:hypothetical protein
VKANAQSYYYMRPPFKASSELVFGPTPARPIKIFSIDRSVQQEPDTLVLRDMHGWRLWTHRIIISCGNFYKVLPTVENRYEKLMVLYSKAIMRKFHLSLKKQPFKKWQ